MARARPTTPRRQRDQSKHHDWTRRPSTPRVDQLSRKEREKRPESQPRSRSGACGLEASSHRQSLAVGQRADGLSFGKAHRGEEPAAAGIPPLTLACQYLSQLHALHLPSVAQNDLSGAFIPVGDAALEIGSDLPDAVGAGKRPTALAREDVDRHRIHLISSRLPAWVVLALAVPTRVTSRRRTC